MIIATKKGCKQLQMKRLLKSRERRLSEVKWDDEPVEMFRFREGL